MTPELMERTRWLANYHHITGDVMSFARDLEQDVPLMMMRTRELDEPRLSRMAALEMLATQLADENYLLKLDRTKNAMRNEALANELAATQEANARNVAELDMVNQHLAALTASMPSGWRLVPEEPSEVMANKGAHVNSEWLNDKAPLGEARYRGPAVAVYREMLASAPTWPETKP